MVAALAAPTSVAPQARTRRQPPEVYRRRRTVALGALGAALIAGWIGVHNLAASIAGGGSRLGPSEDIAARVVVVEPGDTLWSIALASGATGDIRPLVDRLNAEVHGRPLYVGERVSLP